MRAAETVADLDGWLFTNQHRIRASERRLMFEAVADYLEATNGKVYCTNRHKTVRVYGYADGRIRVTRMLPQDKSSVFDGTHY